MIEFIDVYYKNFMSAGNHGITISLNRSPTTLVGGRNGAGKSTVLEAISYCLFGQPLKKIVLSGMINSINKKGLETVVNFTKQGKSYKIVRGEKPKKLELWIDGELQPQTAKASDYQTKIEKVLGMDFKLFTQVTILNKERYVPFMEMKTADRRKVVEDILDIGVFSTMGKLLKEDTDTLTTHINDLKFERTKLDQKIVGQERLISEAQSNIDERRKEVESQIALLEAELATAEGKVAGINANIDAAGDPKEKLEKSSKRKGEFETIATTFKGKLKVLNDRVEFFSKNDHCPTCKQEIDNEFKEKDVTEAQNQIDEVKKNSLLLATEYQKVLDANKALTTAMETLKTLQTDLRVSVAERDSVSHKITQAKDLLPTLVANPKLEQYLIELENLQEQSENLTDELDSALAEEELLKLVKDYLKDEAIKASIVKDYIGFINIRLNEYLNAMNFFLNITLDENFEEKINSINRENFTVDNLSTGQKCRVNLAVWMALLEVSSLKNSAVTNLICLDEVLENLDANGVEDFMKLAKDKLTHKNLFVITQRFDEFKDHFRSNIEFQLVDGFTEFVK